MTAIELRDDHLLETAKTPHSETGWWGMMIFLANEATLFACLIASYFYLGLESKFWPPGGIEKPKLELPLIMTVVLVTSSILLVYAEKQFEQGKRVAYRIMTGGTMLLGLLFLYLQLREYHEKLESMSPMEHAYSSLFFTITGLHGTHVAFGLLFLGWALCREMSGTVRPGHSLAIKNASLYWHFVDGVWLVILTTLYLSPRWY